MASSTLWLSPLPPWQLLSSLRVRVPQLWSTTTKGANDANRGPNHAATRRCCCVTDTCDTCVDDPRIAASQDAGSAENVTLGMCMLAYRRGAKLVRVSWRRLRRGCAAACSGLCCGRCTDGAGRVVPDGCLSTLVLSYLSGILYIYFIVSSIVSHL